MESVFLKMQALYENMGRGEKKIADWVLKHPEEIIGMSISELAAACGCGDATIVRFSRRLGLEGYQAFKLSVAQEAKQFPVGCADLTPKDTCLEIFSKRAGDIALALENTKAVLDGAQLEKAAEAILHASRVLIFGLGNSASIALDAQHKFLRAGLNACAFSDNHMQAIASSHMRPGEVALGISHSGSSKDVVEALKLAKEGGATTICITNYGKSPIWKVSDYKLLTKAEETQYTILAMSSRMAQLAILDSIYSYIVLRKDEAALSAIQETERALQSKKY